MRCLPIAICLCMLALSCVAPNTGSSVRPDSSFKPDLPVARPPYNEVHADWKERLPQAYIYVEHVGSYTETGRLLPGLFAAMKAAGIEPSGPPFGLFYDDPGEVPADRLLSRACFPVSLPPGPEAGLKSDQLPTQTVVYTLVSGPYPGIPQAYPGVLAFVRKMGWAVDGPVREIYITPPESVTDYADLLAEIQVPVSESR